MKLNVNKVAQGPVLAKGEDGGHHHGALGCGNSQVGSAQCSPVADGGLSGSGLDGHGAGVSSTLNGRIG